MDSIIDASVYLLVGILLWEVLRTRESIQRQREPWVKPLRDLGQK